MPQTKIFRDRIVSMEQTLEGGEKHLELLKSLCREALPEFEYRSHALDHERDLFVMTLESADGRRKIVGWTRMVLFDAERIPAISNDAAHAIRSRLVGFLHARGNRPEIIVTFRHLEEGWVDAPESRRDRRRRRGGRGGEGRGARPQPAGSPSAAQKQRAPQVSSQQPQRAGGPDRPGGPLPVSGEGRPQAAARPARAGERPAAPGEAGRSEAPRPFGRRRRFRRRRRGRGGPGSGSPPGSPSPAAGGA